MTDHFQVEILVKAPSPPEVLTVSNVGAAVPRPEDVEHCRRWLASHKLTCHTTEFGIICEGPRGAMESVFGDVGEPVAPGELAEFVMQVTVPREPEFF